MIEILSRWRTVLTAATARHHRGVAERTALSSAIVLAIAIALIAPGSASATFSRSFLRQLTGPDEAHPFAFEGHGNAGGVAVDAEDNLYVGEGFYPEVRLDEFSPSYSPSANTLQTTLDLGEQGRATPGALAIEHPPGGAGHIYVTGNEAVFPEFGGEFFPDPSVEAFDTSGKLLKRWFNFGEHTTVAVDQSHEPVKDPSACGTVPLSVSECFVYVSHTSEDLPEEFGGEGLPAGVEKFSASGEPVVFTASAPYIHGNEITGVPEGPGLCEVGARFIPRGVTVDSEGDIYFIDKECRTLTSAILEYRPSGEFVRVITGAESPGLLISGGVVNHDEGNLGGRPTDVAFDPASDHILVAVDDDLEGNVKHVGVVDEFEAGSGRFTNQISETSSGARLQSPEAMAADSAGDLYVVDKIAKAVDVYGPDQLRPGLRLAPISAAAPDHAQLNGGIDPEGLGLTGCHFQYVAEAAFAQSGFTDLSTGGDVPCSPTAASIPPDHSYHAVSAQAVGLVSGTIYRYRLLGATEEPPGGTGASESLSFTAPAAPRVDGVSAGELSANFAALHAQIDPRGAATSYRFQYVDDASFKASGYQQAQATPLASAGSGGASGSVEANVLQQIGGLAAATTYHFRVLASNAFGAASGAGTEGAFTTLAQPAPGLPDGRADELVTPASKGSAQDMFGGRVNEKEFVNLEEGEASETGDAFALKTEAGFGSFPGSGESAYVFRRDPGRGEWAATSLAAAAPGEPSLGVQRIETGSALFEPENLLRAAFVDQVGSEASSEGGARQTSRVGPVGGPYTTIRADAPRRLGGSQAGDATTVAGISRDVGHVVLDSKNHALAPGAQGEDEGAGAVYDWSGSGECAASTGACRLVNVDSDGALLTPCGALLGLDQEKKIFGVTHNAVSADGSKIFFTAPDPTVQLNASDPKATDGCWNRASGENTPQLYVRSGATTVELSKPEAGVQEEVEPGVERAPTLFPAAYVGASEDGSKVFFVTQTELTKDDEGNHDLELYEYDTQAGRLTRISSGESHDEAAGVSEVKAISADGSAVYFTASTKLTSNAPAAPAEGLNVYRYGLNAARTAEETTFVASIPANERPLGGISGWFGERVAPTPGGPGGGSWYATPDGRYLLFGTSQPLTGYDTSGCGEVEALRCRELFRYDASAPVSHGLAGVAENPACVSCDPSGAPPKSAALFSRSPARTLPGAPPHALSNDGSYAFFDTADPLVTQDTNETLDVYEWHNGTVSLISSGKDPTPSFFLGASADGANVFFGTHARLVAQDTDTNGDVYDARICTSSDPCIKPLGAGTALCEGDACQSPAALGVTPPLGTFTTASSGNVSGQGPAPAKKPAVKPTRAQQLAKALKACRRKPKRQRHRCEAQARARLHVKPSKRSARHASAQRRTGR